MKRKQFWGIKRAVLDFSSPSKSILKPPYYFNLITLSGLLIQASDLTVGFQFQWPLFYRVDASIYWTTTKKKEPTTILMFVSLCHHLQIFPDLAFIFFRR